MDRSAPLCLQESGDSRIGLSLSIAGHVVIALLLMLGLLERIELVPLIAVPIEVVMERSPDAAPEAAPADSPAASSPAAPRGFSGIPAVADVETHAKAPRAALDVNGIDRPLQPGNDGMSPSADQSGIVLPSDPQGEAIAAGGASNPSRLMVAAPIGPAPPQITAREPGEDQMTAIAAQKIECGVMAKRPTPAIVTRSQARVRGFATVAQALAMIRSNQTALDRHINPDYVGNQRLFVESLDARRKFIVLLPAGLTVNVGDVIEYDQHHLDPADSCRYIPNLAVRKL